MAQQIFNQYVPLAKVSASETIPVVAAIAQTRDGKDELLHGTVPFVPGPGGLYVPVSASNRLPVEATLSGHSSPPTLVFINSDTVVPAGTSVQWSLSSSGRAEIDRWPIFAIVLSWKSGSTNLNYTVTCWQYLPNDEGASTTVPSSVDRIDNWSGNLSGRVFVARIRRFAMGNVILRVTNHSQYDQILSNFAVQCMIEGV